MRSLHRLAGHAKKSIGAITHRIIAMLRKLIQAGAIVVLLTGDAFCQPASSGNTSSDSIPLNMLPDSRRRLTPEEQQRERDIEAQYNRTVNDKIPDKKGSKDPWGNIRSAPASSSASKQHSR
jgi:hypothetical protein